MRALQAGVFACDGSVPAQHFEYDERDDGEQVSVLGTRALQHCAHGFNGGLSACDHGLDR